MISVASAPEELSARLRREATMLAGGLNDLAQRACVYHHLYEHSHGNHVFPLLAAHGALWARGYFQRGMRLGSLLKWRHVGSPAVRRLLMKRLTAFADAFRDINRRVCVETYFIYHVTKDPRLRAEAARTVPYSLLEKMIQCHRARLETRRVSDFERRELYKAFFLWEQESIVGPSVERAFEDFDWPIIKALALRPTVRFSYLPRSSPLPFRNFADTHERIEQGLLAFDIAADVGWARVESALRDYGIMPQAFFENPKQCFSHLQGTALLTTPRTT